MFRSERAGLLRPKRFFIALGWTLLALVPLLIGLAFSTHGATSAFIIQALIFGPMSLSYGMRSTKKAKVDEGTLALTDDAVTFGGRELAKRAELTQAFVIPNEYGPLVRLERRGKLQRPLFVRLRDQEEADTFVRALGFDAEHTAAEMRIASDLLGWPAWKQLLATLLPTFVFVPGLIAITKLGVPLAGLVLTFAFVAYVLGLSFAPTAVRVGTDGIVTRWLGRTRFIAHADIERVDSYEEVRGTKRQHGVRLQLRGGEVVRLPTGQRDIAASDAARLEKRIDEAREAHARGAATGTTDVLSRGDRTLTDWIRFLRGMGAGAVGPRVPAVPRDVLLRVVEDSKASPIERASAAVAAIASGDDDVKRRVRIAADATASPKLRVALERIATEEEGEALEEALDELSAERGAS